MMGSLDCDVTMGMGDGAEAFAEQVTALRQLAGQVQRALARSLCLAAAGIADHAQSGHYVNHLLHNVAGECQVTPECLHTLCMHICCTSKQSPEQYST